MKHLSLVFLLLLFFIPQYSASQEDNTCLEQTVTKEQLEKEKDRLNLLLGSRLNGLEGGVYRHSSFETKLTYTSFSPPTKRIPVANALQREQYLRNHCFDPSEIELHEKMYIVAANFQGEVIGHYELGVGSVSAVMCSINKAMAFLILSNASMFFVAHNHPSNKVFPSDKDKKLTASLIKASSVLGFIFLDHIVVCKTSAYSFAVNGDLSPGNCLKW